MEAAILLAKVSLTLNTTNDQKIVIGVGQNFIITDIVLTNVNAALTSAADGEWWQGTLRSGNQLAVEFGLPTHLQTASNYENTSIQNTSSSHYSYVGLGAISGSNVTFHTCSSPIYFSLGTAESSAATCDCYVYGYIVN